MKVGEICRRECERLVVGYTYDRPSDDLSPKLIDNPNAGKVHQFTASRTTGGRTDTVVMKRLDTGKVEVTDDESDDENK